MTYSQGGKAMNVTELVNPNSVHIDEMNSLEMVTLMIEEDKAVQEGLQAAAEKIATAVDLIVNQWKRGGRVFVVGAGTSGRLGILDAVELIPTFSIDKDRWIGLIAGGNEAMWKPLENLEDDEKAICELLAHYDFNEKDTLIGVSASGTTPFVIAGINYAKGKGGVAIGISCNHNTEASRLSDCGIEVIVGPEVIKGSTRLKAGTAQKIVLNILSTATMIRVGKVYQNQMVDMQLVNKKLIKRAERTLMEVAGIPESEASELIKKCGYNLKTAIFVSMTNADIGVAHSYINKENGHLKNAIKTFFEQSHIEV